MKSKYKIVKVVGLTPSTDKYFVYRKGLFFWSLLSSKWEWTKEEAEAVIERDKKYAEVRKKKPEVVGYY